MSDIGRGAVILALLAIAGILSAVRLTLSRGSRDALQRRNAAPGAAPPMRARILGSLMVANVALNAAFLASHAGSPVTMPHVLEAARVEFRKLEKPINEADFRWMGATA